ncbi:MAG: globin [Planctomycetaceae bacterium]
MTESTTFDQSPSDESPSNQSPLTENQIYSVIGSEGIARMVAAFYKQIPLDDILGPMYPRDDLHGAEERLRMFLIFRFGGPQDYLQHRGHPRLRMRHAPFAVNQAARDRWVQLMSNAINECNFADNVSATLRQFLDNVATFLMNR